MKFSIAFVQPNFRQGPGGVGAYMPYSCGLLWAFALTRPLIKENFQLDRFVYQREDLHEAAISLANNDVIAFSTYVWNNNYNYTLAKKIKEINPKALLVFGGPQPPISKKNIFTDYMPFADLVVKQEGELTFAAILESFIFGHGFDNIKGLLINRNGTVVDTGEPIRIGNVDIVPSPYLTGVFDSLIPLEKEWNATLETNRGCPYQCTYCDWGSLTYSKIKKFNLERVFAELEWMGKNKIGFADIADANFGIFPERDNMVVDKLIEVQQRTGFPYRTGWSWAKNQKSSVLEIAKKLIDSGHFNNGMTVSLQTLDPTTLDIVKRSNLEINRVEEIIEEAAKYNVPVNAEMILGLPGETLESWENTLFGLLELGQDDSIEVWNAQLLENTEMNLEQKEKFQIKSQMVIDNFYNGITADEAPEYSEIVVETSTMPLDDMAKSYALAWFLVTWHLGGLSSIAAKFVRKYCNESYKEFYTKLRAFLTADQYWSSEEDRFYKSIHNWYSTGNRIHDGFVYDIEISAINILFSSIFRLHKDNKYKHVDALVEQFLRKTYSIPEDLLSSLLELNRNKISKMGNFDTVYVDAEYDILSYINFKDAKLEKKKTTVKIFYPHDIERSQDKNFFIESIYFARRRAFGKNFLTNVSDDVNITV